MGDMTAAGQVADPKGRYAHMAELDAQVWRKYLEVAGCDIDRVWYDVWVGLCEGMAKGLAGKELRRVLACYAKRIDAVTLRAGLYELWEIKPFGNAVALGQALMYLELFKDAYPLCTPVRACVLCDSADGDCEPIMAQHGILCICIRNSILASTNDAG